VIALTAAEGARLDGGTGAEPEGRYIDRDPAAEPRGRARVRWHDLLAGLGVLEAVGDPHVEVASITHDSRRAGPGACFACIPGARTDGHEHADEAVAAGAVALLVERVLDAPVTQARVASVRAALGPVAARLLGDPSRVLRCLGVTGTNGKTTTTYLLDAIGRAAGERVGIVGTLGASLAGEHWPIERTTPEADELQSLLARMRDAGATRVAMEVSSHALDQHRVDGTWFAAACFTNLTQDHLDYHGTVEAYFAAKALLFDPARTTAAVVNVDDPFGVRLASAASDRGLDVWRFGIERGGDAPRGLDVQADGVVVERDGARFRLVDARAGASVGIRSRLVGRFNVSNAVAAAATARAAGFELDAVAAGLSQPLVVPGRLERVDAGQAFGVFVDYAHTPDALGRVLDTVRALAADGRLAVVFGCGGDRDREKRPLMGRAVASRADVAVLTSDNPRSEDPQAIADAVLPGLRDGDAEVVVELDRRRAIRHAVRAARPGDVVLIAGKGAETTQTFGSEVVPSDDRVVAREELEALACS